MLSLVIQTLYFLIFFFFNVALVTYITNATLCVKLLVSEFCGLLLLSWKTGSLIPSKRYWSWSHSLWSQIPALWSLIPPHFLLLTPDPIYLVTTLTYGEKVLHSRKAYFKVRINLSQQPNLTSKFLILDFLIAFVDKSSPSVWFLDDLYWAVEDLELATRKVADVCAGKSCSAAYIWCSFRSSK